MFCQPKHCRKESNAMSKLSATVMIIGGLTATAYFGYKLMEKFRCKCKEKKECDCTDGFSAMDIHDFEHVSENDCLHHDKKDYYGQRGCFDNPTPDENDNKNKEETL